jgi:uncharacterized protein (DUF1697 family)
MPRYVAFLRGVMPTNAKMADLVRAFEGAGFTNVRTLLSSGNVLFDARPASETALERRAEASMARCLGRTFFTIVRPVTALRDLTAGDPYADSRVPAGAKRVVSFLRGPHPGSLILPAAADGVCMVATTGREVFTAYLPNARGPVFMTTIERTLGTDVTTRTWDTVRKCARA